jgi:hypothetical protein
MILGPSLLAGTKSTKRAGILLRRFAARKVEAVLKNIIVSGANNERHLPLAACRASLSALLVGAFGLSEGRHVVAKREANSSVAKIVPYNPVNIPVFVRTAPSCNWCFSFFRRSHPKS